MLASEIKYVSVGGDIIKQFKKDTGKALLVAHGKAIAEGIDLSFVQCMLVYNIPWNRALLDQQIARVHRMGAETDPLDVDILLLKNTIDQGMWEFLEEKWRAVESIIEGRPISELQRRILQGDETAGGEESEEVSTLARYYLSIEQDLYQLFKATKEKGESGWQSSLPNFGKRYAELYKQIGVRNYMGNNARVAADIIRRVSKKGDTVLDLGSGPELLRKIMYSGDSQEDRTVISTDIIAEHFGGESRAVAGAFTRAEKPSFSLY